MDNCRRKNLLLFYQETHFSVASLSTPNAPHITINYTLEGMWLEIQTTYPWSFEVQDHSRATAKKERKWSQIYLFKWCPVEQYQVQLKIDLPMYCCYLQILRYDASDGQNFSFLLSRLSTKTKHITSVFIFLTESFFSVNYVFTENNPCSKRIWKVRKIT